MSSAVKVGLVGDFFVLRDADGVSAGAPKLERRRLYSAGSMPVGEGFLITTGDAGGVSPSSKGEDCRRVLGDWNGA